MTTNTQLQLALDMLDTQQALALLDAVHTTVDIIEIGTPLLKYQGINILRSIRESYPDKTVLVDTKTMDAGQYEADFCFDHGADIVTVLGAADDGTITGALDSAKAHSSDGVKRVMVDLIGIANPIERAQHLLDLGVDIIGIHSGLDQQAKGESPLATLAQLRENFDAALSVAGGIGAQSLDAILAHQPSIVVVGGAITGAEDPATVARELWSRTHADAS